MLAATLVALALLTAPGQVPEEVLPPNVKEEGFSGAVGAYEIATSAAPVQVRVEEPFVLTVRIKVTDPDKHPEHLKLKNDARPVKLPAEYQPSRRLPALRALRASFEIDELPEKDSRPDADTWEFSYRLRPRSTKASRISRLEYKYYDPVSGQYGSSFSSAIALSVLPRARVVEVAGPNNEPSLAGRYPFQTGRAVLARRAPAETPGPWLVAVLGFVPPACCMVWWRVWRRWCPEASRLPSRRRSRAARRALTSLGAVRSSRADSGAQVASIVTGYLRERLDFPAEEPTPFEAAIHLQQANICEDLVGRVSELLHACDAARFAADVLSARQDLAEEAAEIIRALEEQPCLSQPA